MHFVSYCHMQSWSWSWPWTHQFWPWSCLASTGLGFDLKQQVLVLPTLVVVLLLLVTAYSCCCSVVMWQSSSVFDLVKHDLAEFTSTMQQDGGKVAATVKGKLTVRIAAWTYSSAILIWLSNDKWTTLSDHIICSCLKLEHCMMLSSINWPAVLHESVKLCL